MKYFAPFLIFLLAHNVAAQDLNAYRSWIRYHTMTRGNVLEDMYIEKSAIDFLQKNGTLPDGTAIVMDEFSRDSKNLRRIITMQKTGKTWQFKEFKADKTQNMAESGARCLSCHQSSVAGEDIVFTLDKIK